MARDAIYTEQMPFVGTPDHARVQEALSERNLSKAEVQRYALNGFYGFEGAGYIPEGVTFEEFVNRCEAKIRPLTKGAPEPEPGTSEQTKAPVKRASRRRPAKTVEPGAPVEPDVAG
jgi:hypothetical protein